MKKDKYKKIKNILTKETKGEEILLAIMSLVAITFGILIFLGVLSAESISSLAGENPNLFAIICIVLGIIGLLISVHTLSRRKEKEDSLECGDECEEEIEECDEDDEDINL